MARLIENLRLAYRLPAFALVVLGCLGLLELEALVRRRTPRYPLVNKWVGRCGRLLQRVFNVRLQTHGPHIEQGGCYPAAGANGVGRVFVMNHRSGVDIPILFTLIEAHMVSRHDVATWPLVGFGAQRIGTLFVDRTSRQSGADVQRNVADALERGEGIVMFPEGTVFVDDEVRPFRPGAFKAAQRAGSEIIPLGIAYTAGDQTAFRNPSLTGHMLQIARLPGVDAAVEAGEPLDVDLNDPVAAREAAHAAVQQLVLKARARLTTG